MKIQSSKLSKKVIFIKHSQKIVISQKGGF